MSLKRKLGAPLQFWEVRGTQEVFEHLPQIVIVHLK